MKELSTFIALFLFCSSALFAQVGINNNNSVPDASAMLDVKSTTKGFLPPRMTTAQRDAIAAPVEGLVVFNTDEKAINIFSGNGWKQMIPTNSCPPVLLDTRDGKIYTTIQIGTQCWMAQNLNVGTRLSSGGNPTNNGVLEKYCYNDQETNCNNYGGLYQWNEAMQYVTTEGVQGICPLGWHLPADAEWTTLTLFAGGLSVAGGEMKETGTTLWTSPNTGATNSSGFTALPGGFLELHLCMGLRDYTFFWTSSQYLSSTAYYRGLLYDGASVTRSYDYKTQGYSVRCLKD